MAAAQPSSSFGSSGAFCLGCRAGVALAGGVERGDAQAEPARVARRAQAELRDAWLRLGLGSGSGLGLGLGLWLGL